MRLIKFRFWDKSLKRMFYRYPNLNDFSHPEIIPMQMTGIKDKYGTDIYEDDVMEYEFGDEPEGRFQVVWGRYGWATKYPEKDEPTFFDRFHCEHAKVIGNIHENPELI